MCIAKCKGRKIPNRNKTFFSFFFRKSTADMKDKIQSSQGQGCKDEPLPSVLYKIYIETPASFFFFVLIKEEVLSSKEAIWMLLAETQI